MKTIRIPKVTKGQTVHINRTGIKQVKGGFMVSLSAQEIAGFKIRAGIQVFVPYIDQFSPFMYVEKERLNEILKYLYLEELRKTTNYGKDNNN